MYVVIRSIEVDLISFFGWQVMFQKSRRKYNVFYFISRNSGLCYLQEIDLNYLLVKIQYLRFSKVFEGKFSLFFGTKGIILFMGKLGALVKFSRKVLSCRRSYFVAVLLLVCGRSYFVVQKVVHKVIRYFKIIDRHTMLIYYVNRPFCSTQDRKC